MTVADFIQSLGGTVAVATALDLPPTTVSSWKTAHSIPRWRIGSLASLAASKGVSMPAQFANPSQGAAA